MKSELTATPLAWSWPAQFASVWFNRRTEAPHADRPRACRHDRGTEWFEVDLFPPAGARRGSRFDDTVAVPADTPRRLDATIQAAELRLRALPTPEHLNTRSAAYRARLLQVLQDAEEARARLAQGDYGTCLTCGDPISLALLTERPWRRSCIYCDLDL